MSFTLTSTAFTHQGSIPSMYTCEGSNVSPPLAWSEPPAGTQSLALIVDDPDAPDPAAPQRVWVHWVLFNLPTNIDFLPENVTILPEGTRLGRNDWNKTAYGGPCPPIGNHRYFHKLYALDTVLQNLGEPTKKELEEAMRGHILGEAELIGMYQKMK